MQSAKRPPSWALLQPEMPPCVLPTPPSHPDPSRLCDLASRRTLRRFACETAAAKELKRLRGDSTGKLPATPSVSAAADISSAAWTQSPSRPRRADTTCEDGRANAMSHIHAARQNSDD